MVKKLVSLMCVLLLVVMIPMAVRLRGQLPMDAQPLIEKKYGGWSGVLRLWVHEGWPVGAGSASAWINRCIASFEKAHPGVYIQPEYVDAAAMNSETLLPPDMMLFAPGDLESEARLAELDGDFPLRSGLGGSGRAVPVLLGGYMWAYNTELLDALPRSWRDAEAGPACPPDEACRQWSVALLALCSGKYRADTPQADAESAGELELGLNAERAAPMPTPVPEEGPLRCLLPAGFEPDAEAWRDFINGDAAAIPVTQREVRRLQALSEQGGGVAWKLAASGGAFTDQVMYIGIVNRPGAERAALCRAFIGHLLEDSCQSELHRVGAFSVTDVDSGYGAGDPLREMDAALRRGTLCAPGAFDGEWKSDVAPIVRKFIRGDPDPAALWGQAAERIRIKSEH